MSRVEFAAGETSVSETVCKDCGTVQKVESHEVRCRKDGENNSDVIGRISSAVVF